MQNLPKIMIPERFKNAKYDDVPAQIRQLFEAMPQTRRGIYIHGAVGTGKTHIAYALKSKWDVPNQNTDNGYIPGRWSQFYNMTELLREIRLDIRRDWSNRKGYDQELLESPNMAILDDVGAEKITDWVAETFYLIVNKRYNDMIPTIFTSNLAIPDLAEKIGNRTASRIVEMCDVVELVGADRRVTNKPIIKINI